MAKPENGSTVKYNFLLFAAIVFLFFINFYSETLFYRPGSVHQWRQADCLSITKNYYEEGMHFLSPHVHNLSANDGKAVSELPILNYFVAFLWKVFGEHEFIYRLLDYVLYLAAIFSLFNTLIRFFKSPWTAFFAVSLLLTSPLLTYYSFNFLSDVPALSFCIMAFCALIWFYKKRSLRYFYLSLVLATLAVLMKASAILTLACLTLLFLIDLTGLNRFINGKTETLFKNKILPLLCITLAFYLINTWYHFAMNYTGYDNGLFLLTTLPIWEMDQGAIFQNLHSLFGNLFPEFLNRPMLALFFFILLFIIFYFKKMDVFLRCCFILASLFFVVYILFFFQVFAVHDYYLVNLFILPVVMSFCLQDILSKLSLKPGAYIRAGLVLLFVFNGLYSAAFYRLRVIKKDNLCAWYPFISNDERDFYSYGVWDYENTLKPIEELRPALRLLGVKREDKTVCVLDESPDISLYFMDQKGYTVSRERLTADSLSLIHLLSDHIKYIVLTKPEIKEEKPFQLLAPKLESIFKKQQIEVFKIKN